MLWKKEGTFKVVLPCSLLRIPLFFERKGNKSDQQNECLNAFQLKVFSRFLTTLSFNKKIGLLEQQKTYSQIRYTSITSPPLLIDDLRFEGLLISE